MVTKEAFQDPHLETVGWENFLGMTVGGSGRSGSAIQGGLKVCGRSKNVSHPSLPTGEGDVHCILFCYSRCETRCELITQSCAREETRMFTNANYQTFFKCGQSLAIQSRRPSVWSTLRKAVKNPIPNASFHMKKIRCCVGKQSSLFMYAM